MAIKESKETWEVHKITFKALFGQFWAMEWILWEGVWANMAQTPPQGLKPLV